VLSANQLFYKVVDPHTILVAADQPANRLRLEDQVVQTFYLSHADAAETAAEPDGAAQSGPGPRDSSRSFSRTSRQLAHRARDHSGHAGIERMVRSMDKPRAEIVIDVEILEVSRAQSQSYGLNLSNYQIGFTMSPEAAPPNTSSSGAVPSRRRRSI
jgi:general secretion pathway protein D